MTVIGTLPALRVSDTAYYGILQNYLVDFMLMWLSLLKAKLFELTFWFYKIEATDIVIAHVHNFPIHVSRAYAEEILKPRSIDPVAKLCLLLPLHLR